MNVYVSMCFISSETAERANTKLGTIDPHFGVSATRELETP